MTDVDTPFRRSDLSVITSDEVPPPAFNPRLEIEKKKEQKLREEESNLTFKPTLFVRKGRSSGKNDSSDNRFDRLYSDAVKRHLEEKWKQNMDDPDLTFKPKLTSKTPRSRSASRERDDRLHQTPTGHVTVEVKDEKFSFKPEITKKAKNIGRSQGETAANLYMHSKTSMEYQQMLKAEASQKQAETCTFAPRTNLSTRPPSRGRGEDLTVRMSKFEQMKQQKLADAIKSKKEREDARLTFSPAVTKRAQSSSRSSTPVYERLAAGAGSSSSSRSQTPTGGASKYDTELTFKPQLFSKRAPSPSPQGTDQLNVHDRLFIRGQERKREAEIERELIKLENETMFTFKPMINPRSQTDEEEHSPVFDRLVVKGNTKQVMQNVLAKLKEEMELKDCTFKPTLTASQNYRRNPSVYTMNHSDGSHDSFLARMAYERAKVQEEVAKLALKQREQEMADVTFSPMINPMSEAIATLKRREGEDAFARLARSSIGHPSTPQSHAAPTASIDVSVNGGGNGNNNMSMMSSFSQRPEMRKSIVLSEKEREELANKLNSKKTKSYESFLQSAANEGDNADGKIHGSEAIAHTHGSNTPSEGHSRGSSLVLKEHDMEQVTNRLYSKHTASYRAKEEDTAATSASSKPPLPPTAEAAAIAERLHLKKTASWSEARRPVEVPLPPPPAPRDEAGRLIILEKQNSEKLRALSTPRPRSPAALDKVVDPAVFDTEPRELVYPGTPPGGASPLSSPTRRMNRSGSSTSVSHSFDFSEVAAQLDSVVAENNSRQKQPASSNAVPATQPIALLTKKKSASAPPSSDSIETEKPVKEVVKKITGGGKKAAAVDAVSDLGSNSHTTAADSTSNSGDVAPSGRVLRSSTKKT